MTKFQTMIELHKSMITSDMILVSDYLLEKAFVHDDDKVKEGFVKTVYDEHFPILKQIEFGTEEYRAYELEHFKKAHEIHAQNRHHFYNPINKQTDTDLFDVLEAIIDIKQSQKQYAEYNLEKIMDTYRNKGMFDLDLEKLIYHTLLKVDDLNE